MFGFGNNNKKASFDEKPRPEAALSSVAAGTEIEGNMYCEGDLRIEGRIHGTVICKSRLILGPSGKIDGNVDANNAVIAGNINGNVVTREVLQIQETGNIVGDVVCTKMIMAAGGTINGNLKMGNQALNLFKTLPKPTLETIKFKQNNIPQSAQNLTIITQNQQNNYISQPVEIPKEKTNPQPVETAQLIEKQKPIIEFNLNEIPEQIEIPHPLPIQEIEEEIEIENNTLETIPNIPELDPEPIANQQNNNQKKHNKQSAVSAFSMKRKTNTNPQRD